MLPIIIVDDSREDLSLATRVLAMARIRNPVEVFVSAEECIDFIEGRGAFENRVAPFLLLVDLAMKPISGVDVICRFTRAGENNPLVRKSICIMLSGVQDLNLVNEGYKCGATTFLTKPLTEHDLMQMSKAVKKLKLITSPEGNELALA